MSTQPTAGDEITTRVETVFLKVFKKAKAPLRPEMTSFDIAGWDSLSQVQLVVQLQKEFGIKFDASEVIRLKKVGDFIETVRAKATAKAA